MHIVRNAVSHGVESESQRVASGKVATGTVSLEAHGGSNLMVITVRDDGRGLDYEALRRRGVEMGLIAADRHASRAELARLIFHPGFSTRSTTNEISGRGVGMDVVATALERMHSWIEVDSTPGQGTSVRLLIPLRSVIEHVMVFRAGGQEFGIPTQFVQFAGSPSSIDTSDFPLAHISHIFEQIDSPPSSQPQLFVLARGWKASDAGSEGSDAPHPGGKRGEQRLGVLVDEIVGPEEVVVRPLPNLLGHQPLFTGVTLSGTGDIMLLFDSKRLLERGLATTTGVGDVTWSVPADDDSESQLTALVVDDSRSSRRALTQILQRHGYRIQEAADGVDAMRQLKDRSYDVIFTDLEMPQLNGMDLLREIRTNSRTSDIPVVIVSSRGEDTFRKRERPWCQRLPYETCLRIGRKADARSSRSTPRKGISMSQKTVLVIDDSATIRRLVDTTLSPVGYSVVLAAGADEGFARASELKPDLIILDHQLPGTTGVEVCTQLLNDASLRDIPVIASSTLRKKAYVEYADCPNVVDMLPKPYTAELLITTVANTLDTGTLVVDSQRDGTAVPEVMEAVGDVALTGAFEHFTLRAVLDFLNNAQQEGVLEIEASHHRVWIYVSQGRVQAVTANGINVNELIGQLPESLQDLAPVLRLTVGGGSCSQIEGLVQLLDNKVLDPRLLQKLLRHQAAMLLFKCFTTPLQSFRFETDRAAPALHRRLPLDLSVVALLVEACSLVGTESLPSYDDNSVFSRKAIRGQNLDRAGLTAPHQKLLSQLNDGAALNDVAASSNWDEEETRRVLYAMQLADLVESKTVQLGQRVVVLETDPQMTLQLRQVAESSDCPLVLKVVRDRLSLQLVLKRQHPDVIVVALDTEIGQQFCQEMFSQPSSLVWVGVVTDEAQADAFQDRLDGTLTRPFDVSDLINTVEQACARRREGACAGV